MLQKVKWGWGGILWKLFEATEIGKDWNKKF
jgi:hypothetical protein